MYHTVIAIFNVNLCLELVVSESTHGVSCFFIVRVVIGVMFNHTMDRVSITLPTTWDEYVEMLELSIYDVS